MNLIRAALRRPFTVVVLVIAIIGAAVMAMLRMPVDIFPRLDLPVIYVAQPYGGMAPAEMEGYIVNYYEQNFLYISGIDHIESKSIQNVGLIKLTFHPGTDMSQAMSETSAYVTRALAYMPVGTTPPFIMRFDAGSVPVGDLILSSSRRSQGELDDFAQIRIRPLFAGLPGVSAPPPFGGNPRSIIITLNLDKLNAYHLSPDDVVREVARGNVVLPSGNLRLGRQNLIVHANSVVARYQNLLNLPLKIGGGPTVLLRNLATIEDAADIVSGYAELNGRRVVYIPVTKHAEASTLKVVDEVKAALPEMRQQVPRDVKVEFSFDQSVYVRNALHVLLTEGLLGALLTGLVVWLFLRDGRGSLIVILTIPFALLAAVVGLWAAGQTLNIMTLGGLALAIGILVDEATVTIENLHTHLSLGEPVRLAVVNAGGEVFVPQLLAMLCVIAVFLPSFFMTGVSRSLFIPLSLAVGFAMVASFLLTISLVPVLAARFLRHHAAPAASLLAPEAPAGARAGFDHLRLRFQSWLRWWMLRRRAMLAGYLGLSLLLIGLLAGWVGTDLFPRVDSGQFQLRLRAPVGARLHRTEAYYQQALALVQQAAGPGNVRATLGFVGTQPRSYPINTIYLWTSGPYEAVMQVALRPRAHIRLQAFEEKLRREFARQMPELHISFEAGDIISQVMNLGSPTPVAINVTGFNLSADHAYAQTIRAALVRIPELRDIQYGQPYRYPAVLIHVDRDRVGQLGVSLAQIGRSLTEVTASSRFVARNFWQNPRTGITYQVQVQVPPAQMISLDQLRNLPLADPRREEGPGAPSKPVMLGDIVQPELGFIPGEYDHYNMQRMVSLTANIDHADLGHAAGDIRRMLASLPAPPRGVRVELIGQVLPMDQTLSGLQVGLVLAVFVILLLMMASFQSWRLAVVVVSAAPAVLVGVLLALALTHTTLNIESFMGAIMAIGIAVANGILLVTVAEKRRRQIQSEMLVLEAGAEELPATARQRRRESAREAAVEAAGLRLRPILMTTSAMIAGMIPMALALETGGEQSAPLGRAVIGGLAASTLATLFLMPLIFVVLQGGRDAASISLDPGDAAGENPIG